MGLIIQDILNPLLGIFKKRSLVTLDQVAGDAWRGDDFAKPLKPTGEP